MNSRTEFSTPSDVVDRGTRMVKNNALIRLIFGDRENAEVEDDDVVSINSDSTDDEGKESIACNTSPEHAETDKTPGNSGIDTHDNMNIVKLEPVVAKVKQEALEQPAAHESSNDDDYVKGEYQTKGEPEADSEYHPDENIIWNSNGTGDDEDPEHIEKFDNHGKQTTATAENVFEDTVSDGKQAEEESSRAEVSLADETDTKFGNRSREGMR